MANKPVLMLVGTSMPTHEQSPEKMAEYIDWYKSVHIPHALKAPGMLGATFYKNAKPTKEYPGFLAIYEMESKEAFEKAMKSPEMSKANKDGGDNGPKHGMDVRWHVVYEPI